MRLLMLHVETHVRMIAMARMLIVSLIASSNHQRVQIYVRHSMKTIAVMSVPVRVMSMLFLRWYANAPFVVHPCLQFPEEPVCIASSSQDAWRDVQQQPAGYAAFLSCCHSASSGFGNSNFGAVSKKSHPVIFCNFIATFFSLQGTAKQNVQHTNAPILVSAHTAIQVSQCKEMFFLYNSSANDFYHCYSSGSGMGPAHLCGVVNAAIINPTSSMGV